MNREGRADRTADDAAPDVSARKRGLGFGAVLAIAGAVVLALGAPLYFVLWKGLEDLESREARKDLERARTTLEAATVRLAGLAEDWSYWNDAYTSERGSERDERIARLSLSLTASHFRAAYFDLLYLARTDGKIVWGRAYDPRSEEFVELASLPADALSREHPLIAAGAPESSVSGLLNGDRGLMTVASSPTRVTSRDGPPDGRLILGRFLGAGDLAALRANTEGRLDTVVIPQAGADPAQAPGADGGALAELVLDDIFGQPALALLARKPGQLLEFARSALRYSGLVFMLALWVALTVAMLASQRFGLVRRGPLFQQAVDDLERPWESEEQSASTTADPVHDSESTTSTYGDTWLDEDSQTGAPLEDTFSTSDLMEVVESIHQSGPQRRERRLGSRTPPVAAKANEAAVFRDGIQMVYRNAEVSVTFSTIGVLGIAAMLVGEVPGRTLSIWFAIAVAILGARIAQVFLRRRAPGFPHDAVRLAREFTFGTAGIGILMGAGYLLMSQHMTIAQQAIYTITIIGYSAGGATSLSPHRPAFLAMLVPMFAPLCLVSLANGYVYADTEQALLGLFALAFGAILLVVNSYNNDAIRASLRLRYEKDDLLAQLEESNRSLTEDRQLFLQASLTDALTRLPNRRHFDQLLTRDWRRCRRAHAPMSAILLDIDSFKPFNDNYGHQSGDRCLRRVAECLRGLVKRSHDLPARYGGEEFAVVLPETPLAGAAVLAEELRSKVEGLRIPHEYSPVSSFVTVSVGVACVVPTKDSSPAELVRYADEALYVAKNDGRNRVHVRALAAVPALGKAQS